MSVSREALELAVADLLKDGALDGVLAGMTGDDSLKIVTAVAFPRTTICSKDMGVIIQLSDGSQFQLQIVRSL